MQYDTIQSHTTLYHKYITILNTAQKFNVAQRSAHLFTIVKVGVPLLGLSPEEEDRLIQLVGPRYNAKHEMLRLVSDRFPNRIDNKVRG